MILLDEVLASHASDGDGGYAAVADLRVRLAELPDRERERATAELVAIALSEDPLRRGVALEVVAQAGTVSAARSIYASLATVTDESWKRELVRTVMRLGCGEESAKLEGYLRDRLRLLEGGDLTLIAAFANVSPQASVQIAAELWISMTDAGKDQLLLAYLPSLLINYAKVRPELVGELLRIVGQTKPTALARLRDGIGAYLEKPWAQKQLGLDAWRLIRASATRA